jgi:hypothetical protein
MVAAASSRRPCLHFLLRPHQRRWPHPAHRAVRVHPAHYLDDGRHRELRVPSAPLLLRRRPFHRLLSPHAAVASPSACFAGGLASSLSFTRRRRHHLLISHAQRPLRPSKVLEADGDERHRVVADELAGRSSSACALRPVRGSKEGGNKLQNAAQRRTINALWAPNVESRAKACR